MGNRRNSKFEDPYRWWGTTVSYILARVEYMGHTVNFKTFKTCYRDKHRRQAPKEDWKIFENTHEAIIDKTTWETAQKLRRTSRRGDRNKEPNPLTGLLHCGECGAKMYNERSDRDAYRKTPKDNYVCASYRKKTTSCTIHFIRTEIVRDLILDALRNVATYARANKEDFEQLVMQTTSDARRRSLQSGRTELDRIMRRTNELDTLLQKLYKDYALGRLPEKRHAKLSAQTAAAIALPFSKVEELTGKPLCKSAYKYASYWYPAQDRPLSNTIYNAGYDVDRVDLAAGIVYLTKAA